MISALAIVEKVERKRENREIQNQQATINYNINIQQYNNAMNAIDKMIKEQEKNIDNIKASKNNNSSSSSSEKDEVLND